MRDRHRFREGRPPSAGDRHRVLRSESDDVLGAARSDCYGHVSTLPVKGHIAHGGPSPLGHRLEDRGETGLGVLAQDGRDVGAQRGGPAERSRDVEDLPLLAGRRVVRADLAARDGVDPVACGHAVALGGAAVDAAVATATSRSGSPSGEDGTPSPSASANLSPGSIALSSRMFPTPSRSPSLRSGKGVVRDFSSSAVGSVLPARGPTRLPVLAGHVGCVPPGPRHGALRHRGRGERQRLARAPGRAADDPQRAPADGQAGGCGFEPRYLHHRHWPIRSPMRGRIGLLMAGRGGARPEATFARLPGTAMS